MKTGKIILILVICTLCIPALLFATDKSPKMIQKVIWKIQHANANNKNIWLEFKSQKAENSKTADGIFHIWQNDANKGLKLKVVYIKVDGKFAWFAGQCIEDKDSGKLMNRWLFLTVYDGGTPGKLVDQLWCEWLPDSKDAKKIAERKVKKLEKPKTNKPINSGNIVVNSYEEVKTAQRP